MKGSRRFAANAMWNLTGHAGPLVIAIIAVPIILNAFGPERFGILMLAWAAVGYFNLFDFGLPRVLTQSLSPAVVAGDTNRLSTVSQAGLLIMLAMGLVGGIVMALFTPIIVHSALKIPSELHAEALRSFYLLSFCIPFVVTTSGLRGLFDAHHDFRLATMLRLPFAAFTFVAPLITAVFSHSLVPVVSLLVLGRVLTWAAHVAISVRRYPYLIAPVALSRLTVAPLLRLGGWMTASNIIAPLMYNLDRFIIGGVLSLGAVTNYVTPFELVTKLMLVPSAFIGVLFPTLATAHANDTERADDLIERAMRLMGVIMFPAVILVVALAPDGLRLWVGPEIAREGGRVAQWLALGVFINAVAQVPFTALQASGRPDITAKLHAIELPIYAVMLWAFTRNLGVAGVAAAWTLRIAIDACLLLAIVAWRRSKPRAHLAKALQVIVPLLAASAVPMFFTTLGARCIAAAALLVLAFILVWRHGLRATERADIINILMMPFARAKPAL